MIIDGKVYDVTKFVDQHPGGVDTLLGVAGDDGSAEFKAVGHSDGAKAQLAEFLIGIIPAEELAKSPTSRKNSSLGSSAPGTQSSNVAIAFVVALLALIVYLVMRQ